jgi:YfiH family protein
MNFYSVNNLKIGEFDLLSSFSKITHFVTTRIGGLSQPPYNELNVGFGTDDNPGIVLQNRLLLAKTLNIPLDWFVFPRQTHSSNVYKVQPENRGAGAFTRDNAIPDTDALVTDAHQTCIVVQVADCVPIMFYDFYQNVIAVAHAGWRGTVKYIVKDTLAVMQKDYGCMLSNIIAGIGPSIGSCCYNVGDDVYQAFSEWNRNKIFSYRDDKLFLDLQRANEILLLQSGIKKENIEISHFCTQCNPEHYYSYRYNGGDTGRFMIGIMLN